MICNYLLTNNRTSDKILANDLQKANKLIVIKGGNQVSPIPVTILTGFLGAGKTTLLNQLMQSKGEEKVVIIVNEYGETNIDHELILSDENEKIFQLNNGCMCCVIREDLVEMFVAILSVVENNGSTFDRVIIETSGLAEPSPIAQTILRTPLLSKYFVMDSILTLVDAEHADYQLTHYTEARDQIAFADKILLTKTDFVSEQKRKEVEQEIEKINPFVDKVSLTGKENFEQLIGLDLFDRSFDEENELEDDIDHMIENHEHHHHTHTLVDSFVISSDVPFSEEHILSWLQNLIQKYGMNLMRYKGILNIAGVKNQVILQGVNMAFRLEQGKKKDSKTSTKIVLIGKDLPKTAISDALLKGYSKA